MSTAATILAIIKSALSTGATVGEIAREMHGQDVTNGQRSIIAGTIESLRRTGKVEWFGEKRAMKSGRRMAKVYVAIEPVAAPSRGRTVEPRAPRKRPGSGERDWAIEAEEKTPPELLRAARDLRERGFVGVAPIDKRASQWIVGEMKLSAGEVISLARREVSVASLMGLAS